MYPIGRREPHQPEAKPPVVHTDESPDYETRESIDEFIREREKAEATARTLGGRTAQPVAETREPTSTKEKEPMPTGSPRRKKTGFTLEMGEQIKTITAIISNFNVGSRFNATMVWGLFTHEQKSRWSKAYGSHEAVLKKVRHAVSNAAYSGKVNLVHAGVPATYIYKGGKGMNIRDKQASVTSRETSRSKATPPTTTQKKFDGSRSSTEQWYNDLTLIGYTLGGSPIVMKGDGTLGRLYFEAL